MKPTIAIYGHYIKANEASKQQKQEHVNDVQHSEPVREEQGGDEIYSRLIQGKDGSTLISATRQRSRACVNSLPGVRDKPIGPISQAMHLHHHT